MGHVRKKLVAGNWKMNGSQALLEQFKQELVVPSNVEVVICLPALYAPLGAGSKFNIGAQNISEHDKGAHTGDISSPMLVDLQIQYVLVGHSERRLDHGESNELVALKVKKALQHGLTPILCIGEPLEVREVGAVFSFIQAQLDAVTHVCTDGFFKDVIVAYEPIWAIGTGKTASPEQAQEVHAFIRAHLSQTNELAQNMQILYGGSVNAENASQLFAQTDIDGGLIGGASLKVADFNIICQAAS